MKHIESLHTLLFAENEMTLDEQVTLLKAIFNEPLTGQALFQTVEYLYQKTNHLHAMIPALDIVGTGGDGQNLFNISTASSFIIAGAGVPVLKHGNSGVSSRSGSMDCLKALQVELPQDEQAVLQQFQHTGISFLCAPQFYPEFAKVKAARQALARRGQPSVFNLLGPLLNPLKPTHQLIGVARRDWIKPMAEALFLLGRRGLVFCCAGTDELIPHSDMQITEIGHAGVRAFNFDYNAHHFKEITLNELAGGMPTENAATLLSLLKSQHKGPLHDVVLLNSAFAIAIYKNISFKEAYIQAEACLNEGSALAKLKSLQERAI